MTSEERLTLESWVKKGINSSKKVQQAQMLLNSDGNVERKNSTLLRDIIGVSVKPIERSTPSVLRRREEMFALKPRKTRSDKKMMAS